MSDAVDSAYTADLARILYQQALNGQFTDFLIRAGSKSVHCHQSVVSAKSEYFNAICASGLTEAILDHAQEEDEQVLMTVLKFMYLGKANITAQNVESLALVAEFIRHSDLKRQCEEIMIVNLTVPNLLRYHRLAKKVGLATLSDECTSLAREEFPQVSHSEWFFSLSVDEIEMYLQDDVLNVPSEDDVIDALQRWLRQSRATSSGKEGYVDLLFHCIRLPFCSKSKLDAISKDPNTMDKFRLKIFEYLHHGLYGDRTARKSYEASFRSKPTRTSGTRDTSGTYDSSTASGTSAAFGTSASSGAPTDSPAKSATPTSAPGVTARAPVAKDTALSAGLSAPPQASAADALGQGKLLILGGRQKGRTPYTGVATLGDDKTESAMITSTPSVDFSVCTTGDSLIVSGGENVSSRRNSITNVKQFSLSTMEWADLCDMPGPVSRHGSACVDKRLFSIGGVCREVFCKKYLSSVNVLDLTTNTWLPCEDIPEAVEGPGIAVVEENILAVGGWNGITSNTFTNNTFKLNTKTLKWTTCSPVPGDVHSFRCSTATVDKMVFALMGCGLYQYDVTVDQWNELHKPPKFSFECALVVNQGKLMALGGWESSTYDPSDHVQTYDIASKTWKLEKKRMPVGLSDHWAVVLRHHKA